MKSENGSAIQILFDGQDMSACARSMPLIITEIINLIMTKWIKYRSFRSEWRYGIASRCADSEIRAALICHELLRISLAFEKRRSAASFATLFDGGFFTHQKVGCRRRQCRVKSADLSNSIAEVLFDRRWRFRENSSISV